MTAEAFRIAQELAELLASSVQTGGLDTAPDRDILAESPSEKEPRGRVLCTKAAPAQPLNRYERELAAEATRRLREFHSARHYARMRIRARRQCG